MVGTTRPLSASADFQLTAIEGATKSFGDLQGVLSRQLQLNDMSVVREACQAFERLENDQYSPEKTELLRKINEFCYQFLVKKNKISWYSWNCYFGPSYFRQLYQILQKDAAEYENAKIIGALFHNFIW